jgi:uncharacterized protein (DUF697 family)
MSWCEEQSHLVVVVMQVSDPVQDFVLHVLRQARRRHPEWPVVVAQTGLHRYYPPGMAHPIPYPYTGSPEEETQALLPHALRQALAYQRSKLLDGLRGPQPRFVPIDFTVPADGFPPCDYGLEALSRVLTEAYPVAFEALTRARADMESDQIRAKVRPLIYGCGTAAATAGAVPLPIIGVAGLASMIATMLQALAKRYQAEWSPRTFGQFSGAIGGGTLIGFLLRYGFRELLKLVPVMGTVAAGALNAVAAFALTVAIGEAACVWLAYERRGLSAPSEEVRRAFKDALTEALRRAKTHVHPEPRA